MRHTPETKRKLSIMRRGKNNPFYGKSHTPETRARISERVRQAGPNRTYDLSPLTISVPAGGDLHYLAGLIDADGSIRFSKGRPFIAVYNSSKPMMRWLVGCIGGPSLGKDNRGRVITYTWRIGASRDVYALCVAIRPLLRVKADDADKAINHLIQRYDAKIKH